jgi:malate dehydrogenase (oxaloacetate-decarboxylating)(NADP+)
MMLSYADKIFVRIIAINLYNQSFNQIEHVAMNEKEKVIAALRQAALKYHSDAPHGKISMLPSKSMSTQRDLSLAYTPGVAFPCLEIQANPSDAYKYTSKGNMVAVISNGTAVLGLGNIGALASKPVMEGKSALFKKFANIDSIDIEVNTEDPQEFINCVRLIGQSFGGINLEDIKAPECFIIEDELKKALDIPVFHDDQHGTAVVTLAGLMNATKIAKKDLNASKIVFIGAGAAAIACINLLAKSGVSKENMTLCDRSGVIYKGRTEGMNQWKEKYAVQTSNRTINDAVKGADILVGLAGKGLISADAIQSMNQNPIIFAMANPDPEITPDEVKAVRSDAIIATGRSDYPNQVNNVMAFPYIFRGALDTFATEINDEMKLAAAHSLALLAQRTVPEEVREIYAGQSLELGPEYILPKPFDPRLLKVLPLEVGRAAIKTGVARKEMFTCA